MSNFNPWANGTCKRGHDITKRENQYVYVAKPGQGRPARLKRSCAICREIRKRERNFARFQPRICEECGNKYYPPVDRTITVQAWNARRYCSNDCKLDSYNRNRPRRNNPKPLSDEEVARLRKRLGLVKVGNRIVHKSEVKDLAS